MLHVRRAISADPFPELTAARRRASRRETSTNLLTLILVAAFAGFAFLMLSTILRLIGWVGTNFWYYLPRLPTPDALAALVDLLS
jgi:hypothetical protein